MNQASKTRLSHLLFLIVSAVTTIGPQLADPEQPWQAKAAWFAVTVLLLGVGTAKLASYRNAILGGLAGAATVVGVVYGHFTGHSVGALVAGNLLAIIAQLRAILATQLPADGTAAKSGPGPVPPVAAVLALCAGLGLLGYSVPARAEELPLPVIQLGGLTTCQPAAAVMVAQYNLVTKDFQKGVALGAGYGCVYRGFSIPLGAALYAGAGVSSNSPNAFQATLLLSAADYAAIGIGPQVFRDPVDQSLHAQWLVSLAGNLNIGASVPNLLQQREAVRRKAMAERAGQ